MLEAAGAALLHSAPIGRASISTAVFAMSVLIAGYHIRTGRPLWARIVLAISLTVFGALGGFLVPVGNASALLPVVSFILVLPHTSRRWLVTVAAITLGSTVLILLMDAAFSPAVVPSDFVLATFRDGIIVGVVILVLAGLADFAMVSRDSLRDLHDSTTRQLRVTTSRLSLVAALRKVRRLPTPEATAGSIATALADLPLVDIAVVLEATDQGLSVLAIAGDPVSPMNIGDVVAEPRAEYLLDRSRNGPGRNSGQIGLSLRSTSWT